jgi:hypothetical protein
MNPAEAPETRTPEELPAVVTRLFKGVVYAETDEKIWQSLLGLASHVRDYVAVLGLDLILDESEVDAQWLEEFDARLADYRATLTKEPLAAGPGTTAATAAAPPATETESP